MPVKKIWCAIKITCEVANLDFKNAYLNSLFFWQQTYIDLTDRAACE